MTDLLKQIMARFENDDALEYIEKLCRVIEAQDEYLQLIVTQRENFPECAAENMVEFASEARAEARRLLEQETQTKGTK